MVRDHQLRNSAYLVFSFRIEVLDKARQEFIKSELPFTEKSYYRFLLAKFYSTHNLQVQASGVFREIVQEFNKSHSENKDGNIQIDSAEIMSTFSPTLLEAQESPIFETVGLISQSKSRLNVNLAFLKIALQKYESLNSVPTKTNLKN